MYSFLPKSNIFVFVFTVDFTLLQVIQGYERGVPGMCEGETRTLTVPPHLGYGDRGVPNAGIPGGATLHFTVDLVNIRKGKLRDRAQQLHPNLKFDL